MIKIENTEVVGWEHAIRGMRNPKNSWDRMDSYVGGCGTHVDDCDGCPGYRNEELCDAVVEGKYPVLGPNDHKLMMQLANGGPVHAKYRRMIAVYVDITAPLYWWKEFDTYKIGTVANSCSTMHKIHHKQFERSDFSCEKMDDAALLVLDAVIDFMEQERIKFCEDKKNKQAWINMIQMLPTSYNQMRTVTLNYENLINMYYARRTHKLHEWHDYCDWIMSLPYAEQLITVKGDEEH